MGIDLSGFYSGKFKKFGTTIFVSYNHGTAYDPADIGLTAIPRFDRYILNPRIFFYFNKYTNLSIGLNGTKENRIGGDIKYIEGNGDSVHSYYEKNKTSRFSTQLSLEHKLTGKTLLNLKNSLSYFYRSIQIPGYTFSGYQLTGYGEGSFNYKTEKLEWIGGINFIADKFTQDKNQAAAVVDYSNYTAGTFVQNTWNTSKKISIESGLRGDYQSEYGFFLLPRISFLFKIDEKLTSRLSVGLGYKTPTVFTEDAEKIQFRNVLPIDINSTIAEKSLGGNIDINYHTEFFKQKAVLSVNQLFFYTRINSPMLLSVTQEGYYRYLQPAGFIDTKGLETNIKLSYKVFKLFIGYTYADVKQNYNVTTDFLLVAKHRLNNVLVYEIENEFKAGLEAYYFSPQKLSDGKEGRSYWLSGFMMERIWEHFSLFINFENYLDVRQTKFDSIYTGTISNPVFKDIYAPVDGFVINGGIKIKF